MGSCTCREGVLPVFFPEVVNCAVGGFSGASKQLTQIKAVMFITFISVFDQKLFTLLIHVFTI